MTRHLHPLSKKTRRKLARLAFTVLTNAVGGVLTNAIWHWVAK